MFWEKKHFFDVFLYEIECVNFFNVFMLIAA